MNTKQILQDSLKDAMRSGDEPRKRNIRMALAAIRLMEVDKGGELDETALVSILQKEIKGRRESIEDAKKASRPDLIAAGEEDIRILESFLPQQLTHEELQSMVQQAVDETGAKTPADIGKVMKIILPRIQGRAANDQVSLAIRQVLAKS